MKDKGSENTDGILLRVRNIKKTFRIDPNRELTVLGGITFDLTEGEILGIIGPSGCGKTTLLKILAGLDNDFSGEIITPFGTVRGRETVGDSDRKKHPGGNILRGKIGYIPQEESLFPWRTVAGNVAFGLEVKGLKKSKIDRTVHKLLKSVGLEGFADYYPKQISGGMKQKVLLCRALASVEPPAIVLMDEPFSSLDSQSRNRMQEELLKITSSDNMTVIFVTHNIDECVFLSDRILIIGKKPTVPVDMIEINLPRPRDRTSAEFQSYRRKIMEILSGVIEKWD